MSVHLNDLGMASGSTSGILVTTVILPNDVQSTAAVTSKSEVLLETIPTRTNLNTRRCKRNQQGYKYLL